MTALRHLTSTDYTDAEIEFICNLPELRWLNLFRTKISDRAIEKLAQLPKLEQLFVGQTNITDVGLSSLRYLDLEGTQLTDDILIVLSKLTELEGLNIACRGEQISDRGVEGITKLVNLNLLGFVKPSRVTDGMFERLRRMPKMKNVVPSGCAFLYRTRDPFYQTNEPLL